MQDVITFISNHSVLTATAGIAFLLLFIVEFMRAKGNTMNLSPADVTRLINHHNAVIVDLRSNESYRKGHIIDAYSLTQQEIQTNPKKIERFKARPIIFVCSAGNESQKVAALFSKQGYNAYSLAGGLRAWSNADMPLIKELP